MGATFEIHNRKEGIAFRLVDRGKTLCTSARAFDVVCDAEKAIFAIKRCCRALKIDQQIGVLRAEN